MSHCVYGSRTIHYCLSNITTVLYFGIATCLVIFGHHQAISAICKARFKMHDSTVLAHESVWNHI